MNRAILLFLILTASGLALASSAAWFKWENRYDGTIICAQFSPGEGWVQVQGPYMESQCRKPGMPQ